MAEKKTTKTAKQTASVKKTTTKPKTPKHIGLVAKDPYLEPYEDAIKGRHDPCILPRACPVVEAMAAIGLTELRKERAQCLSASHTRG